MIDDKTFSAILNLCRFHLNDDEKARFRVEIGDILAYIGRLNEVDTSGVDVDLGKALEPDAFRADIAAPGLPAGRLEALSPHFEHGHFLTPPILEELDESAGDKNR